MTTKKNIFLLYLVLYLIACNHKKDIKPETKETPYSLSSVMINNTRCELYGEYKNLQDDDIIGIWEDSLFWKSNPNNLCFYGWNELDRSFRLEIKASKTFVLSHSFSKPSYNFVEMGEYFLNNDSLVTTLILANNPKGEKLFEKGEAINDRVTLKLRWIDKKTIILIGNTLKDGIRLEEGIELKKRFANKQ